MAITGQELAHLQTLLRENHKDDPGPWGKPVVHWSALSLKRLWVTPPNPLCTARRLSVTSGANSNAHVTSFAWSLGAEGIRPVFLFHRFGEHGRCKKKKRAVSAFSNEEEPVNGGDQAADAHEPASCLVPLESAFRMEVSAVE